MNRNDTIKLRGFMAQFINDQRMRYDDMPTATKADHRAKAQAGKAIDDATKLYHGLKVAPFRYKAPTPEEKLRKVGTCPCGADVRISPAYNVPTQGHSTISKVCADCGRQNEVELSVETTFRPVDWHVRDCFCGAPIRLRSDYAGSGFPGYQGGIDFRRETHKNRTAKVVCRRCPCKFTITIRFGKNEEGVRQRWIEKTLVQRCDSCKKIEVEGLTRVEPKQKKTQAS